jgi:two-component system, OmpR family, sensor histidine kinase MprB
VTKPAVPLRRGLDGLDRRWRDLPLRTRLTTGAALAATVAITAVVAVAYIAVRHELRGQIDNNLRHQAEEVQLEVKQNVVTGDTNVSLTPSVGEISGYVQAIDSQGHVQNANDGPRLPVTEGDIAVAGDGGSLIRDDTIGGLHMRVITDHRLPGVAVQVAVPLTGVDRQLHKLAFAFLVLALGGLGLTIGLTWAAVRRVTRPIRDLTEAAERIAETRDLTVRISDQGNDELGRLAATFNLMLDELDRSLGAQRQLIMDASHELRTPLASLRTNAEVLNDLDRLSPDQRRAVLDGIVTQLDELTGLVADVVELARGEAPVAAHEDIAFDELVVHAVERAGRHWPAVTFRLETVPVAVRGVPSRLDRAIANMLDNAGKFSEPGSSVDVTLSPDATLTVADRGPGVPDDALPHVFDRFFRADEARAMPGSGLGLAIVEQVALGHGGSITLENRTGGGAVARLTLPVPEGSESTVPPKRPTAPPNSPPEEPLAESVPVVPVPEEPTLFR